MHKFVICGNQCAGKTTVANLLMEEMDNPFVLKFAQPHYDTLRVLGQPKHRRFMQDFSDVCKQYFGDDIFVRIFKDRTMSLDSRPDIGGVICDDARYLREVQACKEAGYMAVFVDASPEIREARAKAQGLEFHEAHNSESEVPLLAKECDFVFVNDGNLNSLSHSVKAFFASEAG